MSTGSSVFEGALGARCGDEGERTGTGGGGEDGRLRGDEGVAGGGDEGRLRGDEGAAGGGDDGRFGEEGATGSTTGTGGGDEGRFFSVSDSDESIINRC